MDKSKFLEELPPGGKIRPGRPPTMPAEEHFEFLNRPEGKAELEKMMREAAEKYGEVKEEESPDIGIETKELSTAAESYKKRLAITLKTLKAFVREGKIKPDSPFREVFGILYYQDKELGKEVASRLTGGGSLFLLRKKRKEPGVPLELMEERQDVAYAVSVLLKLRKEEPAELDENMSLEELEKLLEAKIAEIEQALEAKR